MLKNFFELFNYQELIKALVGRTLKLRYRSSVLGYAWTWLEPLMMMCIFILVFDVLFNSGVKNFPVYLLSGLVPWTFFNTSINASVNSITQNVGLIKRIYYPREIFPLTVMLTHGVTMFLSFIVLIPVMLAFGIPITAKLSLFPVVTVFLFSLTFGLCLIFATLNVFIRDTQPISQLIMRLWFYACPIFYSVENRVPERILDIYYVLNPMAVLLSLFRSAFMNYNVPKPANIGITFLECILIFLLGYTFFKRNEDLMVKRI